MPQLEHMLYLFKTKEYVNRHLLVLEKTFDLQRASALNFQQRMITQEQEIIRITEKLQQLQQEKALMFETYETQASQLHSLSQELQLTVPR